MTEKKLAKNDTENIHFRFLKILLGVARKTSSWAVASEFGRYPMIIKVFKTMCKFFEHLSMSESPIIKSALFESEILASQGINSWYNGIKRICDFGNITTDTIGTVCMERVFREKYKETWIKERECSLKEGKLGILVQCKKEFSPSSYLKGNIFPGYKRALAKFRTSAHKLPIEVERYQQLPREARVCLLGCNAVGDEAHYLTACKNPGIRGIYLPLLDKLFATLNDINISKQDKVIFILSRVDNDLLRISGKLCYKVLNKFNEITR